MNDQQAFFAPWSAPVAGLDGDPGVWNGVDGLSPWQDLLVDLSGVVIGGNRLAVGRRRI